MRTYESRRVMLDSGLTAIALRGIHERDGQYPFIERFVRRRRVRRRTTPVRSSSLRAFLAVLTRWQPAVR